MSEIIVEMKDYLKIKGGKYIRDLVRCQDCIWWDKLENSPFGYCMAMKHGYMSKNWEIGIYRRYKGDFYCADAERADV